MAVFQATLCHTDCNQCWPLVSWDVPSVVLGWVNYARNAQTTSNTDNVHKVIFTNHCRLLFVKNLLALWTIEEESLEPSWADAALCLMLRVILLEMPHDLSI